MRLSNDIRQTFISHFAKNGHEAVASSPLVPRNDPTLMFTAAGMVQFKNVFTGLEPRPYTRAVTAQKCVRAGGKHNDLDNVGYTSRHHTFFEMLGNFSFGDYFKDTAIELAWDLITREYGIDKNRLYVTVYHTDDEAAGLWRKIAGLGDDRIIRIATSDNFWSMGDTGPCGPCSEIFYDHGDKVQGGPPGSADADGDRFVEIWNLVFMQYEQVSKDERIDLPRPSIDTGMGLERLAAVMQGKFDNYDTDLLRGLIEASAELSKTSSDGAHAASHRIIADHVRASCFLIADGVLPANEGRGYVLRRIMRRAMRHAHILGCKEPLMHRLAPHLVALMGHHYAELGRAEALMIETLKLEETRFKHTLERGLKLLDEERARLAPGAKLPGDVAFKLYDTYGFPIDLTQEALRAHQIAVDDEGFAVAMAHQKAEARKAWAGTGEAATEAVWFDLREKHGATEFLGYDLERAEGVVQALLVDGKPVTEAQAGQAVAIVMNQTPFYAESGGQMGDAGVMLASGGIEIAVADTQKKADGLHVHIGHVVTGPIKPGDALELRVDSERRARLRANHSATHLLHKALRLRLGGHVTQKGSLVAPERLRFDISHPKPLAPDDIAAVEDSVNRMILRNKAVATRLMTPDAAINAGALALFGEKYGEEVRVVSMGMDEAGDYSVELCGGTHVRRTGDIGLFKIISEAAVSSGVRRLEALTGEAARAYLTHEEILLKSAAAALKANPEDITQRIQALVEEKRALERQISTLRQQMATGGGGGAPEAEMVNGIAFIGRKLADVPAKDLRGMADAIKKKLGSGVVALVAVNEDKAALIVSVTDDLTKRLSAVDLVRAGAQVLGGQGGGGRPDFAQAGGPDAAQADAALAAVAQALASTAQAA